MADRILFNIANGSISQGNKGVKAEEWVKKEERVSGKKKKPRWANNTIDDDMRDVNTKGLELSRQALRQSSRCEFPAACLMS